MHYKDSILDNLAARANVAQFVSFDPTLEQRYARIYGYEANYKFTSLTDAISAILAIARTFIKYPQFRPPRPEKSRIYLWS